MSIPETANSVPELEQILSSPYEEDVAAVQSFHGDLLVLGAGGKMGPTLVKRAVGAYQQAGLKGSVYAVSRFSNVHTQEELTKAGARTLAVDLLQEGALRSLPECPEVIYMTGMKFGAASNQPLTWAMNTFLPGKVADRFKESRIVAFSTGNVYPLVTVASGGSLESDATDPIGEYAQSCLGRERILTYFSELNSTPICILRLNYAVEPRYGVLLDIAQRVASQQQVNVDMGFVNVIWQGDANSLCLRAFQLCSTPSEVLNLTGPETLSVRNIAEEFGRRFDIEPIISGNEQMTSLLNNASKCHRLLGLPKRTAQQVIDLVAHWVKIQGPTLNKPTKFEVRNGNF